MSDTGFVATREVIARRQARVLQLHAMGLTYQQIAQQEATETGAKPRPVRSVAEDYRAAVSEAKTQRDAVSEMAGTLEHERLERLQQTVETILRTEAQQGRCTSCGRSADPSMVLKAAGQLVRIAARRAALLDTDLKGKDIRPPQPEDELAKIRQRIHSEHPRQEGRRGPR